MRDGSFLPKNIFHVPELLPTEHLGAFSSNCVNSRETNARRGMVLICKLAVGHQSFVLEGVERVGRSAAHIWRRWFRAFSSSIP